MLIADEVNNLILGKFFSFLYLIIAFANKTKKAKDSSAELMLKQLINT
jgi:hypothetical protein